MSVEYTNVMDLHDETLEAPTQEASTCARCFVCACVGISDETLEAPTQEASTCARCFVCACVGISDEVCNTL